MAAAQPMAGTIGDKYELIENIGRGSFGIISKVKRKSDGKILCRKEINYLKMSTKEREQLQAEINILSSLRHPNIVSYFHRDHIKDTQDLHLYMEYCGGGDLSKVISSLAANRKLADEAYVWCIFAQLLGALYRCHYGADAPPVPENVMAAPKGHKLRTKDQWTVLHRDLKPENVFLGDNDSVKLGDFGLSKAFQGNGFASTYVGTPYYMSPEICNGERYSSKSDIWSLGCIIYELCTTHPPFDAKTHMDLVTKIRKGVYEPLPAIFSQELQTLVTSCLKVNPQKRPTTADLLDNPVIRLMRREREILDMGREFKLYRNETEQMRSEAETLMENLESSRVNMRKEIDDQVRREWEVKARLEIDRQVQLTIAAEREALSKKWDEELPKHVQAAVEEKMQGFLALQAVQQQQQQQQSQRSTSPDTVPTSSIFTSQNVDDFTSDLSSLSMMESPFKEPEQRKRSSRTPFGRDKARTYLDSPMDVQMMSPSPEAAINTLSLSPRRNRAGSGHLTNANKNLFNAANNRRHRWQPTTMSPAATDDELELRSEDEEDIAELPSPTLQRHEDPFKAARARAARPGRPSLGRQQTMPAARLGQHVGPTLFEKKNGTFHDHEMSMSPPGKIAQRSTSPGRERRGGFKSAKTEGAMHKDLMKRNVGRTLVELQHDQIQNRAISAQEDLVLPPRSGSTENLGLENMGLKSMDFDAQLPIHYQEVAVWDPVTCDEMPSPFLVRNKGRGILPVR